MALPVSQFAGLFLKKHVHQEMWKSPERFVMMSMTRLLIQQSLNTARRSSPLSVSKFPHMLVTALGLLVLTQRLWPLGFLLPLRELFLMDVFLLALEVLMVELLMVLMGSVKLKL